MHYSKEDDLSHRNLFNYRGLVEILIDIPSLYRNMLSTKDDDLPCENWYNFRGGSTFYSTINELENDIPSL